MRFALLMFAWVFTACAIKPTSQPIALNYETIIHFEIGKTTSEEVIKKLGQPSNRAEKDSYYSLIYNDQATGLQRVTLNFLKDQKTLSGFLWVPQKNEKEMSFDNVKASYKNADFKEVRKKCGFSL